MKTLDLSRLSTDDQDLVNRAISFAQLAHHGQQRRSGEPYVEHGLAVAQILADWQLPTSCIVAGLLHDVVADGAATIEDVAKEFGKDISQLVVGVTKISDIRLRGSTDEQFVENLRKMILALSHDLRVVLIKLADRLHNMRTLQHVPEDKQARIAQETLEIYAPLADRLEMGQIKGELEDLAFPYAYPQDYQWLVNYAAPHYEQAEQRIEQAKRLLLTNLQQEKVQAEVHGRKKHLYSLYKKLLRPNINRDINLVNDLVAMRVLVETVPECYTALGIIHKLWKPFVGGGGVRDFIAQPKPNGYQSIHTNVFLDDKIAEIQIRTHAMHSHAEYGVAAHFQYSQAKAAGTKDEKLEAGIKADTSKLSWVRQLVELMHDFKDHQQLASDLKMDFFNDRIFVFTPKGDVVDLPAGATPIDFAYHLHTSLGDMANGAKVNGKLVGLSHHLNSGDVCEIVKSKESKEPSRDWLNFVITNAAKKHILKHVRGVKH